MKFYDKNGNKHNTIFGAMVKNVSIKADNFVRGKMPSYEETINENEHLYDAVEDRYAVYPPEDVVATPEATALTDDPAQETTVEEQPVEEAQEETNKSKQEIKIDYAHQCINLVDENGTIVSSSPLDPRLLNGTVDKEVMNVLYPMRKEIPEDFHSDIQSKVSSTAINGHISKTYGDIIPPSEDNYDGNAGEPSEDGSMG